MDVWFCAASITIAWWLCRLPMLCKTRGGEFGARLLDEDFANWRFACHRFSCSTRMMSTVRAF